MSSRLSSELPPLENELILSKVFSFCSVDDLKECRLVGSKVWLSASLNSWREKAVLKVIPDNLEDNEYDEDEEEDEANWSPNGGSNGILLSHLKRVYEDENDPFQLRQKPFKNLKLNGVNCDRGDLSNVNMDWLLLNFPEKIRYVTWKDCQFPSMNWFFDTIFNKLPNLKELEFEDHIYFDRESKYEAVANSYPEHQNLKSITLGVEEQDEEFEPVCPPWFPWQKFLRLTPNLEELEVKASGMFWSRDTEEREETLIMKAVGNAGLQLKNLKLMSLVLTEDGFASPYDFMLPLERLSGTTADVMNLEPFSETLEFLSIDVIGEERDDSKNSSELEEEEESSNVSDVDIDIEDEKVSLPLLKELMVDAKPSLSFTNLNKMEAVNLQTLTIVDLRVRFPDSGVPIVGERPNITLSNPSFANVTRLECFETGFFGRLHRSYVIDFEDFRQLAQSMPNVKHAKMRLTGEGFRELCKVWPSSIRSLAIKGWEEGDFTKIDDEIITGVNPGRQPTGAEGGTRARPPNITDLKLLTDFSFYGDLTDHSVDFGFLQMPRLHYLDINFKPISEEAMAALREKISILKI